MEWHRKNFLIYANVFASKHSQTAAYAQHVQHMSKRGAGAIVPLECDSEVRSEIASSRIWRPFAGAVRENRGGYLKIHREFYREAVDTRANEQSYLHSAIFLSFSPFPLSPLSFRSLGVILPLPRPFLIPRLLREKNVQLCKNTRESFIGGARSAKNVSELISREERGWLMRINNRRVVGNCLLFFDFSLLRYRSRTFIPHIFQRTFDLANSIWI